MKKEDFEKLTYFSYNEKDLYDNYLFHDKKVLEMTKFELMKKLDIIREEMGYPIILHCTYEPTGHTKNSYHYKGMAADFHFQTDEKYTTQFEDLLALIKMKHWKVGVGLYPLWRHKGFHLDVRSYTARWGRLMGYVPIEEVMFYCYENDL